jgi:amino acid permease
MDAPQLKSAWLLPPVIVGLFYLHTTWSWALAGAIAVAVGTLVALDYRGVAARIPAVLGFTRLSWNRSVGARRRTFAFVALWGVLMMFLALGK